ncbi:hypothetical protein [Streptomyces sp. NK15101]|uniref:hypothetical protein n=1 Tax=Streptomyces sp. NK15101 TaxID=2873261 RepID=UPI001CEC3D51|nr:hypothetical protein [Streptomyces sp. NK15101]
MRSRDTLYTGWRVPFPVTAGTPRHLTWRWDGKDVEFPDLKMPARNGEYEWKPTARPDLLVRQTDGVLWRASTRPTPPGGSPTGTGSWRVGSGWGGIGELIGVGDANGDGRADLVGGSTSFAGTGNWTAPFKPGSGTGVSTEERAF